MFVELPSGDILPIDSIKMVLKYPTTETRRFVKELNQKRPNSVISFLKVNQRKGALIVLDNYVVIVPVTPKILVNRINKVLGIVGEELDALSYDTSQKEETTS